MAMVPVKVLLELGSTTPDIDVSQPSMSTLLSSCDRLDHTVTTLPHLPSRGRAPIGAAQISWTYADR
jgi:hypothetical protein